MDWGRGMRFCISLFCAGFIVCGALAADKTTTSFLAGGNVANQNLNTDEYKATAELQMELINSELDEIAEFVRQMNPDLYNQMQSKSQMEQFYAYRAWLATQAFDWYKNRLIADLKLKSKNTGRYITTIESQNINRVFLSGDELDKYISENCTGDAFICEFWLDRGKYDTTECYSKDGFREVEICEYALDFEEYTLVFRPDEIFVIKGDAADNTFAFYDIYLNRDEYSQGTEFQGEVSLGMSYSVGNLIEWIEYENRARRLNNALNGMSKRERKEFINQYENGNPDNTLPGLDVWGMDTETIGIFR